MGFSSLIIEVRPILNRIPAIIISKNNCRKVGIILDGIIGSSDPDVLVDQVSDLSSTKERSSFLVFLFLQTDLSFGLGVMDDSFQC